MRPEKPYPRSLNASAMISPEGRKGGSPLHNALHGSLSRLAEEDLAEEERGRGEILPREAREGPLEAVEGGSCAPL
jgi:hypothetical protein